MNLDISGVDLTGQVAIVTGRERGLSRIIAQTLESAGAVVVANVTNGVERTVRDKHSSITLIVNVIDSIEGPLWQIDPDEWSGTLEANLRSSMLLTKDALPEMVNGGRIINIAASPTFSRLMSGFTAEAKARGIALFSVDSNIDFDLVKRLILFLAAGRADNLTGHFVQAGDGVIALTTDIEQSNTLRLHN